MDSHKTSTDIPLLDVILPTFNNYTSLLKTLHSLENQTVSNFFVHICIDGSSIEIENRIPNEGLSLQFHLLTHPNNEHRGRNATRNLALPHIKSNYIVTIDSDAVAAPTLMEEHLAVVNDTTVSVGMFTYTNEKSNIWAKYLSTRGNSQLPHLAEIPYYYFKTGNVCFSSKFFIELKGQDEQMKHYGGGDTEFSLRVHNSFQPKYLCNSKAVVYSEMDKDIHTALEQFFEFGAINLPYILQKHPNEKRIFSVNRILFHPLFFHLLQFPFSSVISPILSLLPTFFQVKVLHVCVASQIVRGYKSSLKE